jgi:hypothetical protein
MEYQYNEKGQTNISISLKRTERNRVCLQPLIGVRRIHCFPATTKPIIAMERSEAQRRLLFRLKSRGAGFTVSTDLLLQKLGLFQADPSLLDAGESAVASAVPSALFADFVGIIEGKPIVVTDANFDSLRLFSREGGFPNAVYSE